MRKTFFTSLLLLISLTFISQSYLNSTAIWKERQFAFLPGGHETVVNFQLYVDGDTIINSHDFYKIYEAGIDTFLFYDFQTGLFDTTVTLYSEYAFALREDSSKFFTVNSGTTNEVLKYDFNLNLGDTIDIGTANNSTSTITVDSISTVYIGDLPRKWFHLSSIYDLIEGVGVQGGLRGNYQLTFSNSSFMKCFSLDNFELQISQYENYGCSDSIGCMDSNACNYDPEAVQENNTCAYPPCEACDGDVDMDGEIGSGDLLLILANMGCMNPPGPCAGDLNLDGIVNTADILYLISYYNENCP